MRNFVINMSRARDIENNLSPRQEFNLWPPVHRSDALTTELRRARGELGIPFGDSDFFHCPIVVTSWSHHFSTFDVYIFFGLVDQPEGREKSLETIIHQELNFVPFYLK